MNHTNWHAWEVQLAAAGVPLAPASADAAAGEADGTSDGTSAPAPGWAIRLLAGIGGFIGGVMILLFFGTALASLNIFKSPEAALFVGLLLCAGAVMAYRIGAGHVAAAQFGLAVSIAGQLALAIGVYDWFKHAGVPSWWPLVLMQALLLWLIRDGLHRTLLSAAMVVLGSLSCRSVPVLGLWWLLVAFAAVWWWQTEARLIAHGQAHSVAPPVFGALAGLIVMQWPQWFLVWDKLAGLGGFLWFPWHWAAVLPVLLFVTWRLTQTAAPVWRSAALAFALVAGALGLWLPAWSTALLLALLGLASARPGWAVVALLAMIWSVSRFYYDMHITLLEKSAWMAVAGTVCLLLAAAIHALAPRLGVQPAPVGRQREGT